MNFDSIPPAYFNRHIEDRYNGTQSYYLDQINKKHLKEQKERRIGIEKPVMLAVV